MKKKKKSDVFFFSIVVFDGEHSTFSFSMSC